jgi:hypothetical protein
VAPEVEVVVGIETDRGPWVSALVAAGYVVYSINPMSAARYRERHSTSGAKSDAADAHLLAEIVRRDRAHHRRVAGDGPSVEAIKIAARTHQTMIWERTRHLLRLRSALRESFPAALRAFPLKEDLAARTPWNCCGWRRIRTWPRSSPHSPLKPAPQMSSGPLVDVRIGNERVSLGPRVATPHAHRPAPNRTVITIDPSGRAVRSPVAPRLYVCWSSGQSDRLLPGRATPDASLVGDADNAPRVRAWPLS